MIETGKKIWMAMIKAGHTDETLAKKIGVSRSMIYRIIKGKQKSIKADVLESIEKELDMKGGDDEVTQEFAWRLINEYKKDLENVQKKLFESEHNLELARKEIEQLKSTIKPSHPHSKKA